jgi:ABC-type glycerol-3-phosphate transport system substrate-binding protein
MEEIIMKNNKIFRSQNFWLIALMLILGLVLAACSSPEPTVDTSASDAAVAEAEAALAAAEEAQAEAEAALATAEGASAEQLAEAEAAAEAAQEEAAAAQAAAEAAQAEADAALAAAEEMPAAEAVVIDLYNDKSTWAESIDVLGESAAAAGTGFVSVPYPDTTSYQTTVRASLGTKRPPDMFTWWSGFRMEDIVEVGGLEDLSAVWQPYLDSGDYNQGIADAFTFDGKVYAVPFNVAYWVIYYNTAVFDEYGLEPPTTWEEFTAINDTLVENEVTPMAITVDGRWPAFILFEEMVLRTQGPEFWDALMRGEAKYTDPEVVEAMEIWMEMFDKGYFSDPGITLGTASNDILPLFQTGQVAMIPIGDWYSASLVDAGMVAGEDFGAFIMPNPNADIAPAIFFETSPLIVSANGTNKEDAMAVAEWWMGADAQEEWGSLMGFTPPNAQSANDNPVSKEIVQWTVDNNANAVQRYWEATPPDIVETAVDELSRFILSPDAETLTDVLEAIQQKADTVWADR